MRHILVLRRLVGGILRDSGGGVVFARVSWECMVVVRPLGQPGDSQCAGDLAAADLLIYHFGGYIFFLTFMAQARIEYVEAFEL